MKVVSIKASVSGVAGIMGSISAAAFGYWQLLVPVGFGLFFFTLLIQYSSIKIKIATSAGILFSMLYLFFNGEPTF